MMRLFPSLISADLLNLQQAITTLEPHCDGFHIDVMDNHFVPNLTFGPAMVNAIGAITKKPLWAHLMVTKPSSIIERLTIPTRSIITIHYETDENKAALIDLIQRNRWVASIALSPITPLSVLFPLIKEFALQHVLIMLVEPGFSGQSMIPSATQKIEQLYGYKQKHGLNDLCISIDGGITKENIAPLKSLGAQDIAVANAVFNTGNPVDNVQEMREAIQ